MPSEQALAILKVMEAEFATQHADLATKMDVRESLHTLELKIEAVRSDLVRWVLVCTFGQTAFLAGVMYFVLTYVRR